MNDDRATDYVTGLSNSSISGHWDPNNAAISTLFAGERRRWMQSDERRFLGVSWWSRRMECDVCMTGGDLGSGSFSFSIVSPMEITYAEWWRRWGHVVVSRLPRWL